MVSLKTFIIESSKTFEEQVFNLIKPYLSTLNDYSKVKEDYSKYYNEVVKPVESLIKAHSGNGPVTVKVWYDNIYIGWKGNTSNYKDKDIWIAFSNTPSSDRAIARFRTSFKAPDAGVECTCSEELKKKIFEELDPFLTERYA